MSSWRSLQVMILRRFLVEETGCASYLFGCTSRGHLGVVDPHLELVDDYLAAAKRAGSRIEQVFDTHVHADHPSGAAELSRRTGAALRLPARAPVEFEYEPLRDGEVVPLGNTSVQVVLTPGHAWAHACLVVTDKRRGEDPWALFSGDTLLVGSVGRPDLHADEAELARELWRSLHERLLSLPDWVELHPGHVGGSACGAGISSNPSSTIGFERRNNGLLAVSDGRAFAERVLSELGAAPTEFRAIYEKNRRGHAHGERRAA